MISRELATALAPYLSWTPANGDRFYIPRPEIAESEFVVSDMVVELVTQNGESRFHFNGTVEWALDSVESSGVVWLPREEQLRELLGDYFLSLDSSAGGFVVTGVTGSVTLTVDGVARTITTGETVPGASWDFVGFTAPVDNGGVFNVVNAGRTVPLRWRLLHADGSPMTTLGSAKVTATNLSCLSGAPTDDLEQTTTEASGLKNLGNGYYQFNWATPKDFANSCRALRLDVGDGVVHEALFKFTR